jgi:arginine decarboxylase
MTLVLNDLARPQQTVRVLPVRGAVATGPTELAAFDAALLATGVANFNLIRLSSVIAPSCAVDPGDGGVLVAGGWGDRLHVVYAEQRTSTPGEQAWAGIGWVQDETGRGLFVEHEGGSEDAVRRDLELSLAALVRGRGSDFGPPSTHVVGSTCDGTPMCAFVVAVYESAPWSWAR